VYEIDIRPGAESLIQAYNRWIETGDDAPLSKVVERLIAVAIRGLGPSARSEDGKQIARLAVWKALRKVRNPDNKRLRNYVHTTARLAVLDWQRKFARVDAKMRTIPVGLEPGWCKCSQPDRLLPDFGSPITNKVAEMLAQGHTITSVGSELGVSRKIVRKHMDAIKEFYLNHG